MKNISQRAKHRKQKKKLRRQSQLRHSYAEKAAELDTETAMALDPKMLVNLLDENSWDVDYPCPICAAPRTRQRDCTAPGCVNGFINHEDPGAWHDKETPERCGECLGSTSLKWCSACGADITAWIFTHQ